MEDGRATEQPGNSSGSKNKGPSNTTSGLDLSGLPPAFKFQVLSMLDKSTFNKTLEIQPEERLPGFPFMDNLQPDKQSELQFFSPSDLAALDSDGFILRDGFLSSQEQIEAIRDEANGLLDRGELKLAGMSKGDNKWNNSSVRGDLHLWLNERDKYATLCPQLCALLDKIQLLQTELNNTCRFDSTKTQVQVACYPGEGARYIRHLDAFKGGADRRLTVLYYINTEWRKGDGGELRLYNVGKGEGEEGKRGDIDIEPLADRLLVFQSRVVEHEVLPSHKIRFSVTMWLY